MKPIQILFAALAVSAIASAQPLPNSWEQQTSVTEHSITTANGRLDYTATAGYLPITNSNNEVQANMFYAAYTKKGADPKTRPIIFAFNGGPGSSTVWLHMGALGPKMANFTDDGSLPKPPYEAVVNEHTWLEDADIVCIDAIGAGLSRTVKSDDRQYYGVTSDIAAFGEFIRVYLTKFERWRSPLFISGESYGGIRAGGLAGWLLDQGIALNGVIVVSGTMNYQNLSFSRGNDAGYIGFFPTYVATAWHHKKLSARLQRDLQATLKEAINWLETDGIQTMNRGDAISEAERTSFVKKMSEYTGLSELFIRQSNLRIRPNNFQKELLRDKSLTIGRLDGRLTGTDAIDIGTSPEYDVSNVALTAPYVSSLYDYLARELKWQWVRKYNIFGNVRPWEPNTTNGYTDTSEAFRSAMNQNPHMKVLFTCGYYDFACPFYAMEYTVNRMDLKPNLRKNIEFAYYPAGHMMYIEKGSRKKLKDDVSAFIKKATAR